MEKKKKPLLIWSLSLIVIAVLTFSALAVANLLYQGVPVPGYVQPLIAAGDAAALVVVLITTPKVITGKKSGKKSEKKEK